MFPSRVISFSGRAVRIAIYAVLAGVVLFFALTRTEIGREGLRLELERQFADRYDGEIEIGRLSGNLMNRFSASDVQVRDSSGRVVFAIDSVIAHPSWRDLLRRTITTGRITLIRPEVHLTREADGSWNIASVFRGKDRLLEDAPWSFHSTDITVIDGRLVTRSVGDPPQPVLDGTIFDYTDAEAVDLDGRAIVEWDQELKLIDVLQLSGRIRDIQVPIDSLRGQFIVRDGGLSLNEVHVRLGGTRLHLAGSLSSYAELREHPSEAIVEVDLRSSTLRAEELTRIFPNLPFTDEIAASMRAQGPLSGIVLEDLHVARGQSHLSAEGTLLGLPDSLDYELAFRPSSVAWTDVDAVLPLSSLPDFEHLSLIQFSGFSDGIFRFHGGTEQPFWQARSEIQTRSSAGRLDADMEMALGGRPYMALEGSVTSQRLDLGVLTRRSDLNSDLNAAVTISGSGRSLMEATGDLTLSVSRSQFAGRWVDTLRLDLSGEDGHLVGEMRAAQGAGTLATRLVADIDSVGSSYTIDGALSRFDIGPVLLSDSIRTSLDLQFDLTGRGSTLENFNGSLSLAFDESRVAHGVRERVVPPHRTDVTVRQVGTGSPVLEVSGDALNVQITGDVAIGPLVSLSRYWSDALSRSADRALGKPLRSDSLALTESDAALAASPFDDALYDDAASDLADIGLRKQTLEARINVKRSDILSALFPMLPIVRTDLDADVALSFDNQRFALDLSVTSDSFSTDALHAWGLAMDLKTAGSLDDLRANTLDAALDVSAVRLLAGGQEFVMPTVDADFRDRGIDFGIISTASGATAPLRFAGRLDLLQDRTQLRIETLQLAARDQVWQADSTHTIDVYRDAVVFADLTIRRTDAQSAGSERLSIRGTLSPAASDSLEIDVSDLRLHDVMELLAVDRPLGGAMNGQLVYKGFQRRPELTGSVHIEPLSYDDRVIGSLRIDSRYIPGSPDVGLSLHLSPLVLPESDTRTNEPNDLNVAGTFRLPGTDAAGKKDDGALDLRVDIRQLDIFFFEYIFKKEVADVNGAFVGNGNIQGSFARPLIYADLDLDEASFRVPDFNLTYGASGHLSIDEVGIHLKDAVLTDSRNGRAALKGSVLFNEYRYFSFDLHGALQNLRIMNVTQSRELPFYGRISASGDVSLTGPISNTLLRSTNAVTSEESDLYIPITESSAATDAGFIVFADSVGQLPDLRRFTRRANLLAERPAGERPFLEGVEMDLNITAPSGSTVHLVIDPLLGDVINAVGSGRVQLVRSEGEFFTYGRFDVDSGDYLFTAGEVFFRRFLIDDGSIAWDGDPLNATLNIDASYRTRASTEGLSDACGSSLIPLIIRMNVLGRVATPSVNLSLAIDRGDRSLLAGCAQGLEAELNEPERTAQYATSVLLTNSFLLTTSSIGSEESQGLSDTRNQLAFNSLSQLVASQLNRYLNYALPNLDVNLGLLGESAEDLDVTYGVALRLMDERLIIRGQGIYQNEPTESSQQSGLDEFVVEIRLNPSVSFEVFYRREGILQTNETLSTNTTGAGVSYQTQFATWRRFVQRLFGWLLSDEEEESAPDEDVVAGAGGDS